VYRIGFDSSTTSVAVHHALWAVISPLQLVALGEVMRRVRVIKDEEEIKLLAKAAKITTNAFNELLTKIRIGMTEEQVAAQLEELFYEHGATGVAFPSIVASGINGSQPHAQVSSKKLKVGELVTIDCGASYKGYMADMTRTIAVGKESQLGAKARQLYEAVEASQRAGKGLLRAGMKAGDIDAMCRRALQKGGLEAYFTHGTGHGVGLAVHELPVVGPGSETVLQPGMIVTVEPGVYLPKFGGVRIEDTLCITKDAAVNLTRGASTHLIHITR
jgi:Xaa-Pro aminopeptidase